MDFAIFGLGAAEILILLLCFGAMVAIAAIGFLVIFLTRKKTPTRRERDDDDIEGTPG